MPNLLAPCALAFVALIGASGSAVADPVRTQCQADDAIPEFVTQRIELVSAAPAGDPGSAPAIELERDQGCHRGFGTEP